MYATGLKWLGCDRRKAAFTAHPRSRGPYPRPGSQTNAEDDAEEAEETPAEAQAEAEQEKKRKRRIYRAERKALRETIALLKEFRTQLGDGVHST